LSLSSEYQVEVIIDAWCRMHFIINLHYI
jgi:hypothetical protein